MYICSRANARKLRFRCLHSLTLGRHDGVSCCSLPHFFMGSSSCRPKERSDCVETSILFSCVCPDLQRRRFSDREKVVIQVVRYIADRLYLPVFSMRRLRRRGIVCPNISTMSFCSPAVLRK
jgi:hypothetical protein